MRLKIKVSNIGDDNYYIYYSSAPIVVGDEKLIDGGGARASSKDRLIEVCRDICCTHCV